MSSTKGHAFGVPVKYEDEVKSPKRSRGSDSMWMSGSLGEKLPEQRQKQEPTASGRASDLLTRQPSGGAICDDEMHYPRDSGGRLVIAMPAIIEQVKVMDSPTAAERLVRGVPFRENVQAKQSLKKHFVKQPRNGFCYDLVCNTGPKGVGKTTLQCQNMLQMARLGCLSVFIDFNALVPSTSIEDDVPFEARVALRIEYYCHRQRLDFLDFTRRAVEEGEGEVRNLTINDAVVKLKQAVGHDGPVFLAIDELKKSSTDTESLTSNLTCLCFVMDNALRKGKQPGRDHRIFLAVSVYDIVSLAADSSRNLLYQPTPPIFPVWVGLDEVSEDAVAKLPTAVRIFVEERSDIPLGGNRKGSDKRLSQLGHLLFDTGGHGRRIEILVKYYRKLPSRLTNILEMTDEDFNQWHADVTADMDTVLNFHEDVVNGLITCAESFTDPSLFLQHVLEGLFSSTYIFHEMTPSKGQSVRLATVDHYGLLGTKPSIGYLPMPAVSLLCNEIERRYWKFAQLTNTTLFSSTKAMVAEAELSVGKPEAGNDVKKEASRSFEGCMMHTMCAALISGRALESMLRNGRGGGCRLLYPSRINVLDTVDAFPCAFVEDLSSTTGFPETIMDAIIRVGTGEDEFHGLAFNPLVKDNLSCDFVLVLPRLGGGRLILLVQCHRLLSHEDQDHFAFDEFRHGRHFVEQETVPTAKKGAHEMVPNPAASQFIQLKENNTTVHFILLTVNKAPEVVSSRAVANTLYSDAQDWNVPDVDRVPHLRDDESVMDLVHMRGWCPTVAYGVLMALQIRETCVRATS